jgi:hypothetical protein
MAKAIDIGTSFIVGAEVKDAKEVFTSERDAFFSMPKEDFAEEMLNDAGAYYITRGKQLFVVGEDALKFAMLTGNQASYRRPMARGVLNPGEEEAISMLELLIEGIIGKAAFPGEACAATVPAAACDRDDGDTTFHKVVIERCLQRLGYDVKVLNEALAIIFHENPTVTSEEGEVPFSGVGMSFGAGMTNVVVAWRAKKLFEMSVARGGDWIDEKAAQARNATKSKVTGIKERKLDLSRIDRKDAIQVALEIYYEDLVNYALDQVAAQFKTCQATIDEPLEICIAGGTAMVPGFLAIFERALAKVELPFKVKGVRLSQDPLRAVAAGALVAAMSHEKKAKGAAAATTPPGGRIGSAIEAAAKIEAIPVAAAPGRGANPGVEVGRAGSNGTSKARA